MRFKKTQNVSEQIFVGEAKGIMFFRDKTLCLWLSRQRLSYKESGLLANLSPSACQTKHASLFGLVREQRAGERAVGHGHASCRQFFRHRSCFCLAPPALMLHASDRERARDGLPAEVDTIEAKSHLDRRKMSEDRYMKHKINKERCQKSRKSRRREIFSVPVRSMHVMSQR